jgi:hypothetical protein
MSWLRWADHSAAYRCASGVSRTLSVHGGTAARGCHAVASGAARLAAVSLARFRSLRSSTAGTTIEAITSATVAPRAIAETAAGALVMTRSAVTVIVRSHPEAAARHRITRTSVATALELGAERFVGAGAVAALIAAPTQRLDAATRRDPFRSRDAQPYGRLHSAGSTAAEVGLPIWDRGPPTKRRAVLHPQDGAGSRNRCRLPHRWREQPPDRRSRRPVRRARLVG